MSKKNQHSHCFNRKSFILGMITAFCECLANECKKIAFSPPFYPEDYEKLLPEAKKIAKEQGVFLWYEKNPDIPEKARLNWFVLYKFPEVLDEYKRLREEGHNPAWDLKAFYKLLSYGTAWGINADRVIPKTREKRGSLDTVSRLLLKPGDWPPRKT
ncbi:MAG: hypothetical protein JRI79_10955 [Deltaproteobacteria bacterium]|nr:hypothetical protein [Deltaproteobacteria bacterium]MBW1934355.1 hypothetical protein [Deltaproteobacteria bacterium]MBW1978467.1 hypothetical protein [Deltaproteobacteria bacterium]MBW2043461.1 hypothetical protein [Deltaproteobacteria bacterium]MBW2299419.1 hypothetical protein [Deltaproteobacteria bacterium]